MAQRPPRQAQARFKGRLDLVLALSAIFISAMSLLVAIRTEQSQRDTVAASTWPFLQRQINATQAEGITIGIRNDGVGPAKIRSVEILFQGQPVQSPKALLRKCCGYRDDGSRAGAVPDGVEVSLADNTVLRAGEQVAMIGIRASPDAPDIARRFRDSVLRLSFRGCYCSVLDQCWTSDLATTKTTEVAACPAPKSPFDPFGK